MSLLMNLLVAGDVHFKMNLGICTGLHIGGGIHHHLTASWERWKLTVSMEERFLSLGCWLVGR